MKEDKRPVNDNFVNPIDPDKITLTPHALEFGHHAGSALIKPEDQSKIKSRALNAMEHQTDMQLGQIYEQMHLLSEQAKKLQERKQISEFIYQAEIRFEPFINHVYHLYRREQGMFILSMVAPMHWGKSGQHLQFIATVKLLADHTWDLLEKGENFSPI